MATNTALRPTEFSAEEWELRCNLAALYRAFVRYGWTDLIYTHISARLPEEGLYLLNPYGLLFEEITASNLITLDYDGNVVRGDYPCNDAGHAIHHAVLKARPDVNWVLHSHTRAGMAVSCMKCGLLPLVQQSMFYQGHISYHDWDVQTSGQEECDALAADLGPKNMAMILRNHGLLACGRTVGDAFVTLYNLEVGCKVQVDVMQSGQEIVLPGDEELARTAAYGDPDSPEGLGGEREWDAIIRWLERTDTSYRT